MFEEIFLGKLRDIFEGTFWRKLRYILDGYFWEKFSDIFKGDCFWENFVRKYMDIFEKIKEHFFSEIFKEGWGIFLRVIFEGNLGRFLQKI